MTIIRRSDKIQLAQAVPISMLIKRGLGRTQDPEENPIEQEIKALRERFFYLDGRYKGLIDAAV
jgi:hypothetical protein